MDVTTRCSSPPRDRKLEQYLVAITSHRHMHARDITINRDLRVLTAKIYVRIMILLNHQNVLKISPVNKSILIQISQ